MVRTQEIENKIKNEIYNFFAEECGVELSDLNNDTDIIADIDGDSLMFLQLLECWKKEYSLDIEFRLIGKYITKNPVTTLGKAVDLALTIICDKEAFLETVRNQ
ncbi:MAG: Phosphopantetheine attachment site [Syntrophorhabdus sp. PtaU1.Bin153]|nr:MAG: Phosphopantetheine attachment site [Syntrophorhabdus sp. PtaU1.Bin153]